MIRFVSLMVLICLTACSTKLRPSEMKGVTITKHPVQGHEEAFRFMQSRYNFLNLLFEQSREPYYGRYKWSEQCLRENLIGPVQSHKTALVMNSVLTLDRSLDPGACSEGGAQRYHVILEWCQGESHVNEYKIPYNELVQGGNFAVCQ